MTPGDHTRLMTPEDHIKLLRLATCVANQKGRSFACTAGGWRFLMDRNRVAGVPGVHLSASLIDPQRSTEEDWYFLGAAVAVLGAPSSDALLTPLETTAPNEVHHWHWGAPEDVIERVRQAFNMFKEMSGDHEIN